MLSPSADLGFSSWSFIILGYTGVFRVETCLLWIKEPTLLLHRGITNFLLDFTVFEEQGLAIFLFDHNYMKLVASEQGLGRLSKSVVQAW